MNYENLNNNKVYLQGKVISEPVYDHTVLNDKFYTFNLSIPRLSGQADVIPVTISDKQLATFNIHQDDMIALRGQFRSHNQLEEGRSKLILSVFVREICDWDETANPNSIELNGYICKAPIFRITPFNREITDVLVAVNRNYDKSDYIPCIAWGKNAHFVSKLNVGTRVAISGRIQSREYHKKLEADIEITRVAYEVSANNVALVDAENSL